MSHRSGSSVWSRRWATAAVIGSVGSITVAASGPATFAHADAAQPRETTSQGSAVPVVHPTLFAVAPSDGHGGHLSRPDDITRLGSLVYVTYQNNAGKDGSPAGSTSTIVAFDARTGAEAARYSVAGRCDGLTADPTHNRLLASVNEDNNSSLFVITPGATNPAHYTYDPNPAETGTDGTNGGTDAISVAPDGTIYVAHSNPDLTLPAPNNTAAVYTMTLGDGVAHLSRLFGVNDPARVINPGPGGAQTAPLALTDPDSNRFVSAGDGSDRGDGSDGSGTLIQVAQGDSKLVFASHLGEAQPSLRQLNLTNAAGDPSVQPQVDDIERVTGPGTLFVVDQKAGTISTVDTANVTSGTFFVSQPAPSSGDAANTPALSVVDTHTGVVSAVATTFGSPKGLLFVPARSESSDESSQSSD